MLCLEVGAPRHLEALLQIGDAAAAFRDRFPGFNFSYDMLNTNNLELGFSLLWQYCNGSKPELVQLLSQGLRLDCLEAVRSEGVIHTVKRKKATGKCVPHAAAACDVRASLCMIVCGHTLT